MLRQNNTSQMEKMSLDQLISIQQERQWKIRDKVSEMLFKKFYTWLIIGLMKDLTRLLNELIPENTTQEDKETVSDLNYDVIEFPV